VARMASSSRGPHVGARAGDAAGPDLRVGRGSRLLPR
jgi:hypothetical protein